MAHKTHYSYLSGYHWYLFRHFVPHKYGFAYIAHFVRFISARIMCGLVVIIVMYTVCIVVLLPHARLSSLFQMNRFWRVISTGVDPAITFDAHTYQREGSAWAWDVWYCDDSWSCMTYTFLLWTLIRAIYSLLSSRGWTFSDTSEGVVSTFLLAMVYMSIVNWITLKQRSIVLLTCADHFHQ